MFQAKMQNRTLLTLCAVLLASAAFWLTLIVTLSTPEGTPWMGLAYGVFAVFFALAMIWGYMSVKGLICANNQQDDSDQSSQKANTRGS